MSFNPGNCVPDWRNGSRLWRPQPSRAEKRSAFRRMRMPRHRLRIAKRFFNDVLEKSAKRAGKRMFTNL
jgi:hypothetical protein